MKPIGISKIGINDRGWLDALTPSVPDDGTITTKAGVTITTKDGTSITRKNV